MSDRNPYIGWCVRCKKQAFSSRKDAKKACRRRFPNEHLTAYQCPVTNTWHGGHLPQAVRFGTASRHQVYRKAAA